MTPIELAIERAADDLRVAQLSLDGRDMRRRQDRVRVMKDQHIAGRVFGREIHLRTAIRVRRRQVSNPGGPRPVGRVGMRRSIRHDHFVQGV